ncbi:MAG: site-specific DNA-methyltransferase [Alphaproteobacteria bacterium]|nr:site-specific DNA-methyltransferase [Alphaproteobacteria bacterium]
MMKNYRLYHDDCLKILETIPENTFDMIFADPPYMLSNGGITCQNGQVVSVNKGKWDKSQGFEQDFEFHKRWLSACKRVLKKNGTLWVSGTYHSIYSCGFAMQLLGYHILNDISWFKPNASPNMCCRYFTASHETLIWARKDKKTKHTFNYELMKNGDFSSDFIKKPNTQMRSVWAIGTPKKSEKTFGKHPTQKPLDLLKRIILASTNEGDLILDPFMGSATTGVAALKHNRKFVGIEKEKEFVELAEKRLSAVKGGNK